MLSADHGSLVASITRIWLLRHVITCKAGEGLHMLVEFVAVHHFSIELLVEFKITAIIAPLHIQVFYQLYRLLSCSSHRLTFVGPTLIKY
jgi:hypothetical protein